MPKTNTALWDRQASRYDDSAMSTYAEAYRLSIERARAHCAPDSRVLEIGCGTGIIGLALAPYVQHVTGTDLSQGMLDVAQQKVDVQGLTNVTLQLADGARQPFDDGAFDVVLLFNTLLFVANPAATLAECRRLLAPGGTLLLATDCMGERMPPRLWPQTALYRVLRWLRVMRHLWFFRREDVRALVRCAGFEVVDEAVLHEVPVNWYVAGNKR